MASAAITIVESPATIESDGNEAVITNGSATAIPKFIGELRNHGPADVWLKIGVVPGTNAATVVTTGAQAQLQCPLPAGSSLPVNDNYANIAHVTAAGTAVLSWVPHRRRDN